MTDLLCLLRPRELEQLTDAELATWVQRTMFEWARQRPLSWKRWRWRWANSRALHTLAERLLRDAGPAPGLCRKCEGEPATTHWAYGEGTSLRFAQFCEVCAVGEPPGGLVVGEPERRRSSAGR